MKTLEGVPYHRFVIRFTLATGERRRWVRYSPALSFMRSELVREWSQKGIEPTDLKLGSCSIRLADQDERSN